VGPWLQLMLIVMQCYSAQAVKWPERGQQ